MNELIKSKLGTKEQLYCENCDFDVDFCDDCNCRIDITDEVYCDGYNHFCKDCKNKYAEK